MRLLKQVLVTAAFVAASVLPTAQALAQEATPVTTPLATAPAYCSGEPANLARIREIAGSSIDGPNASILGDLISTAGSTPASQADTEAVTALMNTFVACVNADDPLRAIALLSDDFIKRAGHDILSDLDENTDAPPAPLDAETQARVTAATPVVQLPDGRFAITFDLGPVTGEDAFARIQLIAIDNDGTMQIDDMRFVDIEGMNDAPDCGVSGADGCQQPDGATPVVATPVAAAVPVEGEGYSGWLMNAAQAEIAMPMFNITDERYMPKDAQEGWVIEAEAALPAYLATQPNATPRLIADINNDVFERQYFVYGYEFQYLLVINGYCPDSYIDPSIDPVMVLDGGDCFWQATYDIRTHQFVSLSVNGNA